MTDYLRGIGINVQYLHSEIDAIERVEILRSLRKGEFDVLVGINLLREGLDLPEVSLVAILDADKEGFLRSETSLIQTAGRAARHLQRRGDSVRRRDDQQHQTISGGHRISPPNDKSPTTRSTTSRRAASAAPWKKAWPLMNHKREADAAVLQDAALDVDLTETISELETEMLKAAEELQFEKAALLRDQIKELKHMMDGTKPEKTPKPVSYKKMKRTRNQG